MIGNAGANRLDGKSGADTMIGREGNDTYFVDNAGDRAFEAAGGGTDMVYSTVSFALTDGQEIEGLSTITWELTNAINLTGNSLNNYLIGNAGVNVLDGKAGNDTLHGREGTDTYAFTTVLGAGNIDVILGFSSADDTIALENNGVFVGLSNGALPASAFVIGTAAQDSSDRIIYNQATGQLFFDADGNGAGAANPVRAAGRRADHRRQRLHRDLAVAAPRRPHRQPAQRLADRGAEIGVAVDVVMAGVLDRPVEGEVGDGEAKLVGARGRDQPVAAAGDDRDRNRHAPKRRGGLHAMAEEQPDRQPRIMAGGDPVQRIERRDQDQPVERPLGGERGGDAAADAEPDRDRSRRAQAQPTTTMRSGRKRRAGEVMDQRRIREQGRGARPPFARRIAAIVEDDDVGGREELGHEHGRRLAVPAIAGEAEDEQALARPPRRRDVDSAQALAGRRRELDSRSARAGSGSGEPAWPTGKSIAVWPK